MPTAFANGLQIFCKFAKGGFAKIANAVRWIFARLHKPSIFHSYLHNVYIVTREAYMGVRESKCKSPPTGILQGGMLMDLVFGIVGLVFLLAVHELSHGLVGVWRGYTLRAFTLGIGPSIGVRWWGRDGKPVRVGIGLLPIGASCEFEEEGVAEWDWRVVLAGPISSLLLGILLGGIAALGATDRREQLFALIGPLLVFVLSVPPILPVAMYLIGTGIGDMGGVVAATQELSTAASAGWVTYVTYLAILSAGLGGFNLWPVPPLDGGRLLMIAVRRFYGRRPRFEMVMLTVGGLVAVVFLVGLLVHDVLKLVGLG